MLADCLPVKNNCGLGVLALLCLGCCYLCSLFFCLGAIACRRYRDLQHQKDYLAEEEVEVAMLRVRSQKHPTRVCNIGVWS